MKTFKKSKRWLAAVSFGFLFVARPEISGFAAGIETVEAEQMELAEARWEQREDGFYYYKADGSLATGWTLIDQTYFYMTESGRCLMNAVTPDRYYVNPDGTWQTRSAVILDHRFQAPKNVPFVTDAWAGEAEMKKLQAQLDEVFSQRRLRITDAAIEYLEEDGKEEKVLLGIYKNTDQNSYRLTIQMTLDKDSTSLEQAATYDYAVFKALLYQLTSTPDYLEDAIYSSWKEENRWNINRNHAVWIGDSQVKYMAGAGCGYYHIYPAGQK